MPRYGRDDEEWERLTEVGCAFLVERARRGRVTSYTELNAVLQQRTGLAGFDFTYANERAAMGHLLGLIVDREFSRTELMLSAIVLYLDANNAGSGFYALAKELGLLPANATRRMEEEFWVQQIGAVYDHYKQR